jgi:uncharacterized protein YbjT (DUF2867 family)
VKLKHADEIVNIDYTRPETITSALNNVDRLFLRIPPSVEMVDISSSFIGEAKKNGVKFIVKLSAMSADLEPGYTSGRLHRQVEKIIEESGIPFVFLRPNSFMLSLFIGMAISPAFTFYLTNFKFNNIIYPYLFQCLNEFICSFTPIIERYIRNL